MALEACKRSDSFTLDAVISAAGGKIFEFFGPSARPLDHSSINLVVLAYPEGHGQLRLRQIAGTALHQPGLANA